MNMRVLFFSVLLFHAAGLAAEEAGARTPSVPGAMIGFSNVSDGDALPPEFVIKFSISGMGIAPAGSEIEGTGHFHLLIDVVELPDFDRPLPATEQIIHYGKGQTETTLSLPEGDHTLQLLLADYAHVPHDPPVISKVITITVSKDAPMPGQAGEDG